MRPACSSIWLALTSLFLLVGCPSASPPPPPPPPPAASALPVASAAPSAVPDYRAFEDVDSDATLRWVKARDAEARARLEALPSRGDFHEGLARYIQLPEVSRPWRTRRGELFYERKVPGKSHRLLVRSRHYGDASREEIVIDPNAWSEDGRIRLTGWVISHDETRLAYGASEGGSDWCTWRVLDLKTLEPLADTLRGIKWDTPAFTPGDRALFYTGYENRSHDETAKGTGSRVYLHRFGTAQEADPIVYRPKDPEWIARAVVNDDATYAVVYVYKSSDGRSRIELFPWPGRALPADPAAVFADPAPHVLSPDFAYRQWSVALERDAIYVFSERDAPKGRVDRYTLSTKKLETVIPPRETTLEDASRAGGLLFAKYIDDLDSVVRVHDLKGEEVDEIRMSTPSNLAGFRGASWSTHTYYSAEGYARPDRVFEYDLRRRAEKEVWALEVDGVEQITAEQRFYPSKDGTKIPMFVVHPEGLERDGSHPTLLIGYGCYGYVLPIHFSTARVPWLQRGGVLAVANIRGGGAYGEAWHEAGKKENKQTSIDDFVAAAEFLQREGYTSPEHTAILGASCGGLLVGATLTQRPELFGAAVAEVGVHDLLNFHRFSGAYLWKDELGSPEVPEERAYLAALSPVERAKTRRAYPPTLITTRKKDTRVSPMSSYKLAAALRDHQTADAPILLRVDETGGHSSASLPLDLRIDYLADVYAFAWDMAGGGAP